MENIKLKLAALYMILLIVFMPLYSVSVIAEGVVDKVHSIQATGSSGVSGYIADYDKINITEQLEIAGDNDITPNQLYFQTPAGGGYFSQCTSDSFNQVFTCKVSQTIATSSSTLPISVLVYRQPDAPGSLITEMTQRVIFHVDSQLPVIEYSYYREGSHLIVNVHFSDVGAGLYQYQINFASFSSGTQTIAEKSDATPVLNYDTNYSFDISSLATGDYTLTIWVSDRLDSSSIPHRIESDASIYIDNDAPLIGNISVTDTDNNVVRFVSPKGSSINLKVGIISTKHINATADLSAVGSSMVLGECQNTMLNYYECEWRGVTVNKSGSITIISTDEYGLRSVKTFTAPFKLDSTPPVFDKIHSNHYYLGKDYLGRANNILSIKILESGSGITTDNVLVNYESLVPGASSVHPSYCNHTSNSEWYCYFPSFELGESYHRSFTPEAYVLDIPPALEDVLGNRGETPEPTVFYVDLMPPYIKQVRINAPLHYGVAVEGDSIQIIADIQQLTADYESPIPKETALLNASPILEGNNTLIEADSCGLTNASLGEWQCIWNVDNIKATPGPVNLSITLEDAAGNSANSSIMLTVYQYANDTGRHFFIKNLELIPKKIDRKIISQLTSSYNIFQHMSVVSDTNCRPVNLKLADDTCYGDSGTSSSLYGEVYNLSDFYVLFKVQNLPGLYIKQLNFNCTFNIVGVCEGVGYVEESASSSVSLPLYNNPLGNITSGLKEKIKDKVWLVDQSWTKYLTMLAKLIKYMQNICNIYQLFSRMYQLVNSLMSGMYGILVVYHKFQPMQAENIWKSFRNYACKLRQFLSGNSVKKFFHGNVAVNKWGYPVEFDNKKRESWTQHPLESACALVTCAQCYPGTRKAWIGKDDPKLVVNSRGVRSDLFGLYNDENTGKPGFLNIGTSWLNKYKNDPVWGNFINNMQSASIPTPEQSIVTAINCRCLPAVILHLEKLRQIECKYLWCVQIYTSIGAPIKQCDEEMAKDKCTYVMGAIFSAFPLYNAAKYLSDFARSIVQYFPAVAINKLKEYACPGYVDMQKNLCKVNSKGEFTASLALDKAAALCGVADAAMWAMTVKQYFKQAFDFNAIFAQFRVKDFCKQEGVQDLIDELNED